MTGAPELNAMKRQADALENIARELKGLRKAMEETSDNIRRFTAKYVAGVELTLDNTKPIAPEEPGVQTLPVPNHPYFRSSQKEN